MKIPEFDPVLFDEVKRERTAVSFSLGELALVGNACSYAMAAAHGGECYVEMYAHMKAKIEKASRRVLKRMVTRMKAIVRQRKGGCR